LRRKSMAKTVRRIMSGQTGGSEILIHQHIDLVAGEVVLCLRPTGEEIPAGRVVISPDLSCLCHI
jgi:phosphotransferase system IIA component